MIFWLSAQASYDTANMHNLCTFALYYFRSLFNDYRPPIHFVFHTASDNSLLMKYWYTIAETTCSRSKTSFILCKWFTKCIFYKKSKNNFKKWYSSEDSFCDVYCLSQPLSFMSQKSIKVLLILTLTHFFYQHINMN